MCRFQSWIVFRCMVSRSWPASEARGLVRSARTLPAVVPIVTRPGPGIRPVDPAVQAPQAWPREHQVEKDDTEQDRRIGTIERPVSHRYLGRCGQGGDAGVE